MLNKKSQNLGSRFLRFSLRPIIDQSINSLISLAGSLIILSKLTGEEFAAAGFMISLAYSASSILKNNFFKTLNFVRIPDIIGPKDLLNYVFKETRLYALTSIFLAFIILLATTRSTYFAIILILLSLGLFIADVVRNACIVMEIQDISIYAGCLSLIFIAYFSLSAPTAQSKYINLVIYTIFQYVYLLFYICLNRKKTHLESVRSLKVYFLENKNISQTFKIECIVEQLFSFLSVLILYLFRQNFYSAMLIAAIFSASIPRSISNGILPKLHSKFTTNIKNFSHSLAMSIALSILIFSFAWISHYNKIPIINLYASKPYQAFDIIYGTAAFSCSLLFLQIFSLDMKRSLGMNYLHVRLSLWIYVIYLPVLGAVWADGNYFNYLGFLSLITIIPVVIIPHYMKGKNEDLTTAF
jgi:hypothetical protein